jgi:hypothetical protein
MDTDGEPKVKVTMNLPAALVKRAKHHALDADRDFQDIVADALTLYLSRQKKRGT